MTNQRLVLVLSYMGKERLLQESTYNGGQCIYALLSEIIHHSIQQETERFAPFWYPGYLWNLPLCTLLHFKGRSPFSQTKSMIKVTFNLYPSPNDY